MEGFLEWKQRYNDNIRKAYNDKDNDYIKRIKKLKNILNEYLGKADALVLISQYDRRFSPNNILASFDTEPYDIKYPYGKYKLNKADGEKAIAIADRFCIEQLRKLYDEMTECQKASLPPFDDLYADIKSECIAHEKRRKRGLLGEDESHIISDLVYDGKVKYTEPYDVVWHFYDKIGKIFCGEDNCTEVVERLASVAAERPYDLELRRQPFDELLPHLVSVTPTFVWNDKFDGDLYKEFKFAYNEQVLTWFLDDANRGFLLRNHLYRYLALYRGDELLFSDVRCRSDCLLV